MASVPSSSSSAPPPPTWDARPSGTAQVAYGGFWIRLVAYIIDGIILGIVGYVVALIFGIPLVPADPQTYDPTLNIVSFVIGWLYFAVMESSPRGATLGKMAMGLRVVTSDGQRLSFLNATGRYFAKIISAIILFIGFIMIGFTDKKRGLHDMIAGTLVIKVR
ncbi:MAG TPA: RDD family protein [Reyranella sp.]|nr:RDD family protein [Reyranella sp.]